MAYPLTPSPAAERAEQLARLVYELIDAHADTERLAHERPNQLQWRAHLSYLRDLQRVGREILAESTYDEGPESCRDRGGEQARRRLPSSSCCSGEGSRGQTGILRPARGASGCA